MQRIHDANLVRQILTLFSSILMPKNTLIHDNLQLDMLYVDSKILHNHTYQSILMPTNQTSLGPEAAIYRHGFKNTLMLFYLYVDGSFLLTLPIVEWDRFNHFHFSITWQPHSSLNAVCEDVCHAQ